MCRDAHDAAGAARPAPREGDVVQAPQNADLRRRRVVTDNAAARACQDPAPRGRGVEVARARRPKRREHAAMRTSRLGELTLRRDDLKSQRDDLASRLDESIRGQPAVRVCDDVVCFRVILCDTTRGVS